MYARATMGLVKMAFASRLSKRSSNFALVIRISFDLDFALNSSCCFESHLREYLCNILKFSSSLTMVHLEIIYQQRFASAKNCQNFSSFSEKCPLFVSFVHFSIISPSIIYYIAVTIMLLLTS